MTSTKSRVVVVQALSVAAHLARVAGAGQHGRDGDGRDERQERQAEAQRHPPPAQPRHHGGQPAGPQPVEHPHDEHRRRDRRGEAEVEVGQDGGRHVVEVDEPFEVALDVVAARREVADRERGGEHDLGDEQHDHEQGERADDGPPPAVGAPGAGALDQVVLDRLGGHDRAGRRGRHVVGLPVGGGVEVGRRPPAVRVAHCSRRPARAGRGRARGRAAPATRRAAATPCGR